MMRMSKSGCTIIQRNAVVSSSFPSKLQKRIPCSSTTKRLRHFTNNNNKHKDDITSSSSFLSNPLSWYATKLETHPYTTKCITSGMIAGGGDLQCQYLVHTNKKSSSSQTSFDPDLYRTSRFALLGFGLVAPAVHVWYNLLMTKIPGVSLAATVQRTCLDQFGFAPIFLCSFMTSLMVLEGSSTYNEIVPKLKKDYGDALISNWGLWIPAMIVNFRFVPSKYQVLYSNMVGFVWNTYLSWKTQEAGKEEEEGKEFLLGGMEKKELIGESRM